MDRTEGRNGQYYNNSWILQYPHSTMDRTTRLKNNKEIENLNNTIYQLDLT